MALPGILRDLAGSTRLLILLELTTHRPRYLKDLAAKLGMTVQGVSEYMRAMAREGLVESTAGGYRATVKGVSYLHEHFVELKEFTDRAAKDMPISSRPRT